MVGQELVDARDAVEDITGDSSWGFEDDEKRVCSNFALRKTTWIVVGASSSGRTEQNRLRLKPDRKWLG